MSTIPPNWLTSIVGSQGAQHTTGSHKSREAAEQSDRAGTTRFSDSLQNVIENSDKDSEVYTDSEGLGSQGREEKTPEEAPPEPEEEPGADDAPGSTLDLQA